MSKTSITYNEWQEALRESQEISNAHQAPPKGFQPIEEIAKQLDRSYMHTRKLLRKMELQGLATSVEIVQQHDRCAVKKKYYKLCPKKKRKSLS